MILLCGCASKNSSEDPTIEIVYAKFHQIEKKNEIYIYKFSTKKYNGIVAIPNFCEENAKGFQRIQLGKSYKLKLHKEIYYGKIEMETDSEVVNGIQVWNNTMDARYFTYADSLCGFYYKSEN